MTDRPARLPRIAARGTPHERGMQYGAAAADRIRKSVAFYRDVFRHRVGLDWETAVALADYEPSIARFAPG